MGRNAPDRRAALAEKTALGGGEITEWRRMAEHMRIPYDPETLRFEQHDGFFSLPHIDIGAIPASDFPLYSHWSYERIYRNDMLKQPDVLMFMFLFGSEFSLEQLGANFDYYEPRCIHESSLSPSVHSILAARLGRNGQAYELFRFAARLDLDNYNRNTDEGLHITSIAGSWMNIVYGFGGLESDGGRLSLSPSIPTNWAAFSFNLQYRGRALRVKVTRRAVELAASGGDVSLTVYGRPVTVGAQTVSILMP
jgi:maltose phosphorylase